MIKSIKTFLKRILPEPILYFHTVAPYLSDKALLKRNFKKQWGKKLDLKNPRNFNEKLQWLKLYNHNPAYTNMVDKYEAKKYVSSLIGEECIIPTLGIWKRFDDIPFDSLPNQFVLKTTHDSGGVVICKDKAIFDMPSAKRIIQKSLKHNFYWRFREWPYKHVKPRIIAEQYMQDESGYELKDYKVFCFNGEPKMIQVDFDRFTNHRRNIYTTDWEYVDLSIEYPTDKSVQIKRPVQLTTMLEYARVLSKGIPFLRTDFYIINDKVYFGELTFYHGAGTETFTPESWNLQFGEWIDLSNVRGN